MIRTCRARAAFALASGVLLTVSGCNRDGFLKPAKPSFARAPVPVPPVVSAPSPASVASIPAVPTITLVRPPSQTTSDVAKTPRHYRSEAALAVAGNLEKAGAMDAAIEKYRSVVILYPTSASAKTASGRLKALKGKVPLASEYKPIVDAEIIPERLGSKPKAKPQPTIAQAGPLVDSLDTPLYSVPSSLGSTRSSRSSSSGPKSVHVNAYTRKDGTHVQSHSRSAPHSGGSRRK